MSDLVSDLFKLNELHLLLHGEEQLPQFLGFTRGLVAANLYYDGRKALVQALKILMSGRLGLTWSIEAPAEITDIVTEVTDSLMEAGLTETILGLLASLDWTQDLAGLQRNAALGDPHHVSTAQLLHADIKQVILQFTLFTDYIMTISLSIIFSILESGGYFVLLRRPERPQRRGGQKVLNRLSSVTPSTATGCLDDVNLALVMAALASFNVGGTEDEENVPKVRDKDFIADIGWELEVRAGRRWETPGLLSLLQLAWSMSLAGLRSGAVTASHAVSHLEEDEMFVNMALENIVFHSLP